MSWRLHPLVRQHCARRRFRETPPRYRSIHRRLVGALVQRGETVAGMRHAVEAGEPGLCRPHPGGCQWRAPVDPAGGLTTHGVRYHLRKLFTKLGANTRADALHRARELDLISAEF